MIDARYSVLTSNPAILGNVADVGELLAHGIKIIGFAEDAVCQTLKQYYAKYVNARLLQLYRPTTIAYPQMTVIDGQVDAATQKDLDALSTVAPDFNYEQYKVEHYAADANVIVEAGAGTGKTTVMIDRILYLLHVVPNLQPEDIGMITFTNEATQHMKVKIQQAFMTRYSVTGLSKYVRLLEKSAAIRIQTIDSFSNDFISEFGTSLGYANKVTLRGFKYEKDQIIRDVLDDLFRNQPGRQRAVRDSLGLDLYDLNDLIYKFWERFCQVGLADDGIANLDWGAPINLDSAALHDTLKNIFTQVVERYNQLKNATDSVSVDDIVRELDRILSLGNVPAQKSHKLSFLFVDEFQDSDNSQIRTIAWLKKACDLRLFVVGDVKQSIYRFRGAVDTAFDKLRDALTQTPWHRFALVRNYRTSADILTPLDGFFRAWQNRKLLTYGSSLLPQNRGHGTFNCTPVLNKEDVILATLMPLLKKCRDDCIVTATEANAVDDETRRVTVLTRTNYQLKTVADKCRAEGIPCYVQTEGTFYRSDAVLAFFAMIRAYAFPTDVAALMDYAMSAYSPAEFDPSVLTNYDPGSPQQVKAITTAFAKNPDDNWTENLRRFRINPIMAVIEEIVVHANPAEKYASLRKQIHLAANPGMNPTDLAEQLKVETTQFSADTDKLLTLLRAHFSGQMANPYVLYNFLKLNIATNHNESSVDVSTEVGINCIRAMTVHRAKGLEFDTVVIPFTNKVFRRETDTEILLDETSTPMRAGWSYVKWADQYRTQVDDQQKNDYYDTCVRNEMTDVDREEARLLYVALTRSIRRLEVLVSKPNDHTWANLLR